MPSIKRDLPMKNRIPIITVVFMFITSTIFAGLADIKTKRSTIGESGLEYYFNLGIAPQFDGSLNLGGSFDMSLWKWLYSGFNFSRSKVAISSINKTTGDRKLTLIESETLALNFFGYKWDIFPKNKRTKKINGFHFALKPSVNGVRYFQATTLNKINRKTDSYKYEDANLESWQLNGSLSMWLEWEPVRIFLSGSITPYSYQRQDALGFDSLDLVRRDKSKNEFFPGATGDYEYETASTTFYWATKAVFVFPDLALGGDIMVASDFNYLSYKFESQTNTIFNGAQKTVTTKTGKTKLEAKFTFGWELAFLDFGNAKPFPTFNVTFTQFQDINNRNVFNIAYGFGITFRR